MAGVVDELQMILSTVPEDAKVIPGHGAQASIADVRRSLHTLQGKRDAVQRQVRVGKTLDEIRKMNVLSPWQTGYGLGEPCVPHKPCDHLDSEFYLTEFYRALATPN